MFPPSLNPPLPPEDDAARAGMVEVLLPDRKPVFTRLLVGTLVAVFVVGLALGMERMYAWGAKVTPLILGEGEYYRMVTLMFLHAGVPHLLMNGYALWVIGPDVERFYGSARFALIFFLGGLTGSVFSVALTPGTAVGASGGVFAVFAAEMVLLVTNRALFGDMARQRLRSLALLLVLNAAIGFAGRDFIDNWAHLGGFVGGAVVGFALAPRYRVAYAAGPFAPAQLVEESPGGRPLLVAGGWLVVLGLIMAWLTATWRG